MNLATQNISQTQDYNLTLTETLVFSSLISAVDPVAVLGEITYDLFWFSRKIFKCHQNQKVSLEVPLEILRHPS